MAKKLYILTLTLLMVLTANAQYAGYAIGFYNLENLFDTQHDEGKNDFEFLPDGSNAWTELKYQSKLKNMAQVLAEMGTDKSPEGCAFIGVSEVENANVLNDLINQEPLKARKMEYCHIDGPDKRGVDCGLLYNPKYFTVNSVDLVPYIYTKPEDEGHATRGFLTIKGKMAGDDVCVIVCHWPSRGATAFYRNEGGRQVRELKDQILKDNKHTKVFVMGDMNDDPSNESMTTHLGCKSEIDDVKKGDMYNPWYNIHKKGTGTLAWDGAWNLFDQIVISPNLLNKKGEKDFSTLKYHSCQIFRRPYLFQTEGKYKGNPKRTHAGGSWLNGYSDHLPVVMYLAKKI
ncbi:MAG: endonuclease/exonuclease/phosphatase family protein [Prevotella sp.]|nr:endonuclease/exonuclease/phosphatase family protein [Prevotella sp.]